MDVAGTSASAVGPEELAEADQKFERALALRGQDPEQVVELLGEVLAVRNRRYGEEGLECASAYFHYGQALFEQAQAATDVLGEPLRRAAQQRAQAQVAAEAGDDADGAQSDEDEEEAEEDGEEAGEQEQGEGHAAMMQDEQQRQKQQEEQQQEQGAVDKGKGPALPQEEADSSEGSEDEGEEEQEEGDEGEGADGQEGNANAADGADDMALAWEMLEMARLIYERAAGPVDAAAGPSGSGAAGSAHAAGDGGSAAGAAGPYASELADIHLTLGDIACEQEDFEGGASEYKRCLGRLAALSPPPERRLAEAHYKLALALQFLEQPGEALKSVGIARARLQARINQLRGGEVALAGTTGNAAQDDAAARAKEVDSIRLILADLDDKTDELRAIVAEHESMKGMIMSALRVAAGSDGPSDAFGGGAADGAASGTAGDRSDAERNGGMAVAPVAATAVAPAPVRNLGVVGGGRRVAPVPVAPSGAIAAATAAPVATAADTAGDAMATTPPVAKGAARGKRSLDDLMGGNAAAGGAGAGGAPAAVTGGFGASKGNLPDSLITTPEMKRLRLVSPAPAAKTGGAENEQQQP